MKPKVLAVEDQWGTQHDWRQELGDAVLLISAYTIEEARALFAINPDIDAIIMDACVPGSDVNTLPLVQEFRQTFKGPMIAASRDARFSKTLMDAGCDYSANKDRVIRKLRQVLGL